MLVKEAEVVSATCLLLYGVHMFLGVCRPLDAPLKARNSETEHTSHGDRETNYLVLLTTNGNQL